MNSDQHQRVSLVIFSNFRVLPDANSESVDELMEEGNAFEAEAVQGVEDAEPPDVSEVTTREVPEDDVPRST
jgi:hypothetical protein